MKKQVCPYCQHSNYDKGIEAHRKEKHAELWAIKNMIRGMISKMDEEKLRKTKELVIKLYNEKIERI